MYFTDEKDYIMRMIKEMVRVLFSLMFGKKYVSVELEKENKYNEETIFKDFYDSIRNLENEILDFSAKKKYDSITKQIIKAVKEAKKVSKYVLLSNQSSNYPTPELLEVALLKNNLNYEIRHTMLTDAEYEDNLGKETFFREYLYVIRGDVND